MPFSNTYSFISKTLFLTVVLVFSVNLKSSGQPLESPINATRAQSWYANQVIETSKKINNTDKEDQAAKLYKQYLLLEYGYRSDKTGLLSKETENRLKSIFLELKANFENSFEYQHLAYHRHRGEAEYFKNLTKATDLNKNMNGLHMDHIEYFETSGDAKLKKRHCIKLKSQINAATLEYNYNVLMSLNENAILITNGISDTYPIWVLQEVDEIRKDVTILNTQLLENLAYRERIFEKLNLTLPKFNLKGSELIDQIINKNPYANLYLSLTSPKNSLKNNIDNLYIQGLAYKINPTNTRLESNWRKFKSTYRTDLSASLLNANYIVPLISLHKYYRDVGDVPKQNAIYSELKILCDQLPNGDQILKGQ